MSESPRCEDYDSLYDLVNTDDLPVSNEMFKDCIEQLVYDKLITTIINDSLDDIWYICKNGLTYTDISNIDNPIKKQILLVFIQNPKTIFILFNTQKGKSAMAHKEIISWTKEPLIVGFLMVDNDSTLGDQSVQSLLNSISTVNKEIHLLRLGGNNEKSDVQNIINFLDSYASFPGEKPMPLIVALTNVAQTLKVVKIINHIKKRNKTYPNLRAAIIWDEADKTYSSVRDKEFDIGDTTKKCIRNFTLDDTSSLYRNVFITATQGSLLDEYPECANAYAQPPYIDEEDKTHYRAFHHEQADIKIAKYNIKCNNNANFLQSFNDNKEHFMNPIKLSNGNMGFRKTIINANVKTDEMRKLALHLNKENCHAMLFNQSGLTVYGIGKEPHRFKTRRRYFNELLYYAVKRLNLDSAPLFIVGRRKVDRGLGFHYAPRSHREIQPKTIEFDNMGHIVNDGIEGLIWTDQFLGNINDKSSSAQKAGRLAGIIGQCPQYPGKITWWTNEETAISVKHHCEVVDLVNMQINSNIGNAVATANKLVKKELTSSEMKKQQLESKWDFDMKEFTDLKSANNYMSIKGARGKSQSTLDKEKVGNFYESSTTKKKCILNYYSTIEEMKHWGKTSNFDVKPDSKGPLGRMYICYKDIDDPNSIVFICRVITLKQHIVESKKTITKLKDIN
jgi:hypothetical protein